MSIADRGAMVALRNEGRSWVELAEHFQRPGSTLRGIFKHWQTHGTVEHTWGPGGPRALNDLAEERLVRSVRRHPKVTVAQLAATEEVSATTVRKTLHEHKMNHRVCRTTPIITPATASKRRAWAEEVSGMDWRRVIFTDEAAYFVGDDVAREMC
jgi:transposase